MMTDNEFKTIRRTVNDMKRILKEIDECGQAYPETERNLTLSLQEKAHEVASMTITILNRDKQN